MEGTGLCQHSDKGLSKLSPLPKRNPNIRRAGIRCGDVIRDSIPCLVPALLAAMACTPRCNCLTTNIFASLIHLDEQNSYHSSALCVIHIKLAIFYHSTDAASGHPLVNNATQPPSPLSSEVDSGRGAGWEMRRCKRERRRILSVTLILRDVSCCRRAFRRVRDT